MIKTPMIAKFREEIENFNERQRKLFETSVFMLKMLTAGAFFHLLLMLYPNTNGLQAVLAEATQHLLGFIGVNLEREGIKLIDSNVTYLVTQDCLGWKSMAAFSALIFSSTTEYRKHLKPLITGLIAINIVNLFRVTTTIYLSHIEIISFDIIHSIFWKWGLTFFVIVIWIGWLYQKPEK